MTSVLYRCWPVHADASSADSSRVFRFAVQTSQHPAFSPDVSLSDAGYGAGTESRGLRERHSDWLPCVVISNLCSTPLLNQSLISGAQTTSLRRSSGFTSCARLSAYNSSWRCWSSNPCMDWLGSTWSTTLSAYSWHALMLIFCYMSTYGLKM